MNPARLFLLPFALAGLLFLGCEKSASPEAGLDPADLLPMDNDISGFAKKGSPAVMTDYQSIMDAIDGAAEKYIRFGFQDGVQQMYSNGSATLDVQIFNHGNAANASGIFEEFYPPSAEVLVKENPQIVIDHSLLLNYSLYYQKNGFFMRIDTSEKTDFMLNMAKQFCLNIDAKIE
ncbi:MAG: DUF6599 family protein [Fibrobacterota bacterium]